MSHTNTPNNPRLCNYGYPLCKILSLHVYISKNKGQRLLTTGYHDGKQIYNVTESGKIVKFQPTNTPDNEYHAYEVKEAKDIPASV